MIALISCQLWDLTMSVALLKPYIVLGTALKVRWYIHLADGIIMQLKKMTGKNLPHMMKLFPAMLTSETFIFLQMAQVITITKIIHLSQRMLTIGIDILFYSMKNGLSIAKNGAAHILDICPGGIIIFHILVAKTVMAY